MDDRYPGFIGVKIECIGAVECAALLAGPPMVVAEQPAKAARKQRKKNIRKLSNAHMMLTSQKRTNVDGTPKLNVCWNENQRHHMDCIFGVNKYPQNYDYIVEFLRELSTTNQDFNETHVRRYFSNKRSGKYTSRTKHFNSCV
jgi:hypothetical protein